jgi:hypothetical protein
MFLAMVSKVETPASTEKVDFTKKTRSKTESPKKQPDRKNHQEKNK